MRKAIVLSALIGTAVSAQAHAGDWNGFHAGLFGGSGKTSSDWKGSDDSDVFDPVAISTTLSDTAGYYGAYAGFDHQMGQFLVGVEADYGSLKTQQSRTLDGSEGLDLASSTDNLGSVRARFGLIAAENFLFYVSGGYGFESSDQVWDDMGVVDLPAKKVSMKSKGVFGAGVEYALNAKLHLRAEGLWYRFDGDGTVSDGTDETDTFEVKQKISVLRVGIAYTF